MVTALQGRINDTETRMTSTARYCGIFFRSLIVILFAESIDTAINLALNKNVMQYSQDPLPEGLWSARNAVDGDKACTSVDSTQFTLSGLGKPPWWQVDLGLIYIVDRIIVYGRRDSNHVQLQGFVIHLSTTGIMDTQFTLPFNQTSDTNTYPADGVFDIRFSATQARYVRLILERTITTQSNWPIVICEVEVFGPNELTSGLIQAIRENVKVEMGDPVKYSNITYSKDKAIDNSPRTDPDACDCCSTTADGRWTIDLGRKYLIKVILILGRSDGHVEQIQPFNVSVGELTTNLTEIYSGFPNQGNHVYFITLQPAMVIQIIKVSKKTLPSILTICEFQVYGLECLDGHFGPGCQHKGFCNGTYHMATGECPSCLAGYKGNTCSKACKSGSFGPGCIYRCGHCLTGLSCNAQTGICPHGCRNGYKGSFCTQSCDNNTYGQNCDGHCGHCNSLPCDIFYGHCSGHTHICKPGFQPPKCDTECVAGTFGDDCTSNCSKHCSGGDICHKTSGLCPNGCLSGYNFTGDGLCLTECTKGTYGLNCAEKCGYCRDGVFCNTQNGHCPSGCERGDQGAECKNECPNGLYGYDCTYKCHCKSDSDICDPELGSCSNGCAIGWGGHNCSTDLSIINHVSHGVNAVQQSTYDMCNASNIYNGKILTHATSNDTLLCQVCSVTQEALDPWLQIDFGRTVSVGYIKVYGRGNQQSTNLLISASNVSFSRSNSPVTIANIANASISGTTIELPLPRTFQYLVIRKNRVSMMSICEVGLYGKECPAAGSFGDRCRRSCHCKDGKKCDILTGKCSSPGCFKGWRGTACDISCSHSKFGLDCSGTCHCYASGECDRYNGTCKANKCEPGWRTLSCDVECEDGWFGDNCNMTCGVCMNGAVCDKVSGNCSVGCVRGRRGNQCISDEKQVEITKTGEGNTAVAVLATLLAVAIIGNVVLFTLYCRRKKGTRKGKEDQNDQNHYTVPAASMSSDYAILDVTEMNNIHTD